VYCSLLRVAVDRRFHSHELFNLLGSHRSRYGVTTMCLASAM
jgi:hypothetical protein